MCNIGSHFRGCGGLTSPAESSIFQAMAERRSFPLRLAMLSETFFFYATAALLLLIFAGPWNALALVAMLAAGNGFIGRRAVFLRLTYGAGRLERWLAASLVNLGIFPWLWLASALLLPNPWRLVPLIALYAGFALIGFSRSSRCPEDRLPGPRQHSGTLVLLALLLVVLLTYVPFHNLGKARHGEQVYRPYFSSDYLKQYSFVRLLNGGLLPPENPYFSGRKLHYYWLPYAVPACLAAISGDVPGAMAAWSALINLLFFALFLQLLARLTGRLWQALLLALAPVVFLSVEGFYLFVTRAGGQEGNFFALIKHFNVDALVRWWWQLPEIDALLRALLYTPQHLLAVTYLLLFFSFFERGFSLRPLGMGLLALFSLQASFFMGFFMLGIVGLHYLIFYFVPNWKEKGKALAVGGLLAVAAWPALGFLVFALLEMVRLGEQSLLILPISLRQWPVFLGLNFGLLLGWGVIGLFAVRPVKKRIFFTLALLAALTLILTVRFRNFDSDVSLKIALAVAVMLAITTAHWLGSLRGKGWPAILLLLTLLPGAFTAAADWINAATISDPGRNYNNDATLFVPRDESLLLRWIERHSPAVATVQTFPRTREEYMSIIPAFSGRKMAVGDRIHARLFQVSDQEYESRLRALEQAIGRSRDGDSGALRRLKIDFLFWGRSERDYFNFTPRLPIAQKIGHALLLAVPNAGMTSQ